VHIEAGSECFLPKHVSGLLLRDHRCSIRHGKEGRGLLSCGTTILRSGAKQEALFCVEPRVDGHNRGLARSSERSVFDSSFHTLSKR